MTDDRQTDREVLASALSVAVLSQGVRRPALASEMAKELSKDMAAEDVEIAQATAEAIFAGTTPDVGIESLVDALGVLLAAPTQEKALKAFRIANQIAGDYTDVQIDQAIEEAPEAADQYRD